MYWIILKRGETTIALGIGEIECPGGRPDVLYFYPAAAGATDSKFPLAAEKQD